MISNYLDLIIILKSLPKEEHKPHLHNIQCVDRHVSIRYMHDLLPTYSDRSSLSKYSS